MSCIATLDAQHTIQAARVGKQLLRANMLSDVSEPMGHLWLHGILSSCTAVQGSIPVHLVASTYCKS